MISKELQLLIESIKIVLLDSSSNLFKSLVNDPKLNWQRVNKLLKYHSIRPIFYQACRNINFHNDLVESIGAFTKKQAIKNLNEIVESTRVLTIFKEAGITALPYKGLLFLEKIYENKPLREIGDLDILVTPDDSVKALELLIEDGYKLCIEGEVSKELLTELIRTTPSPEVGLDKITPFGMNVHIDFHWGINEFTQYKIDLPSIFNNSEIATFQNNQLPLPNTSSIFKMLLNHHGGRECWVKLKHLADLIAFKKTYPQISYDDLIDWSADMDMRKMYVAAESLLDSFFFSDYIPLDKQEESVSLKRIAGMWEYATHWDKIMPKIFILRIFRKLQDRETSWNTLIYNQIKFHSVVNLTENKRLFVLPEKYVFLNAFSKLISYIVRVYLKPPKLSK
ncbi:MAG: nucleotidyltransferase family protein [Flavobacterium sp.]|jgi:hypothetical protein|nr:nucleotidyltransferase family protein [Flavobacterium sp.]